MIGKTRFKFYWIWQSLSLLVLTILLLAKFLRARIKVFFTIRNRGPHPSGHPGNRRLQLKSAQLKGGIRKALRVACSPLNLCRMDRSLLTTDQKFHPESEQFSQSIMKTDMPLPKAPMSKNEHFPATSMKTFFSKFPPISQTLHAFHSHIPMRNSVRFVSHFVGAPRSSGWLFGDLLGGNGKEFVFWLHTTRSESLDVLVL